MLQESEGMVNLFNMEKVNTEKIYQSSKELKNLPNKNLLVNLSVLSEEFEKTKNEIISLTHHLDEVEKLYNITLKELEERK